MAEQLPGWYADPTRRHTYRYWDGSQWSDQVSDGGTAGVDPIEMDPASASTPPAPGTQAPGPQVPSAAAPPPPGVEVTQRSGGTGVGVVLGVLITVIIVSVMVFVFNDSGDDGTASTTDSPATTVITETTQAPATTAP